MEKILSEADKLLAEITALCAIIPGMSGKLKDENVGRLVKVITELDAKLTVGEDLPSRWMYIHD